MPNELCKLYNNKKDRFTRCVLFEAEGEVISALSVV
jgi:hypothetical protein